MRLRVSLVNIGLVSLSILACPQLGMAQLRAPQGGGTGVTARNSDYIIGGINVTGVQYLDADLLQTVSGLSVGSKVKLPNDPGIARAIRNLWRQDLFSDVQVLVDKYIDDRIFLTIQVEERPRLSKKNFSGIKKSESEELDKKTGLVRSKVVTEAVKKEAVERIRKYYADKGYGSARINVIERPDPEVKNSVILTFEIDRGTKTKINHINIAGNEQVTDARLKKGFRNTREMARLTLHPADEASVYETDPHSFKQYVRQGGLLSPSNTLEALDPYFRYQFWRSSKFNPEKFAEDRESILAAYNALGYRDASIVADTTYLLPNGNMNIDLKVAEGQRYYFGDISWKGNTKYTSEQLSQLLSIKRGDVYNQELLDRRLGRIPSAEGGEDVTSAYMDDGYLFFQIEPVEKSIIGDTINYEMRITEGTQATVKNVTITGNDRTNEHVIRREIRTLPGSKFSRTDIIRSQREISALGFFDPEKTVPIPKPNPEDGTVDIEYQVAEKSSDQLQLSLGFGGGVSLYGNIGIQFNNFSLRNVFKPKLWDPLPVGDGQKLSLNFQSNGVLYNSLNFSFTEPWLGGRKPNALTTSLIYSRFSNYSAYPDSSYLRVIGGGLSLSRRLKWPDDNFVLTTGVNYQRYNLKNYNLLEGFNSGTANNLYFRVTLARYSVDQPLYPRSGSDINFTFQFTPPYSLLSDKDYKGISSQEKYKFVEYHRYRFNANWYQRVAGNLVLKFGAKYGFLGYYNSDIGYSPFERFQVGGDGLTGQNFFIGRDIIAHRGYEVYAQNATIFNKYQMELRYPFSLSPTSTIYGLAFFDMANGWSTFKDYNPFRLRRSAGVGVRLFLPMFGLLGLDYGIGFDNYNPATGITNLKDMGRFNFMLGFEPE
ncbi:MAG: outer membrane protein assembly factor [Sphingobacteriales bacterium]|nr:MAG: outer membrane protein assembly factor [Sphingobacteriales bacterium]